eukprot:PhF_6_TR10255/c0_g1_i1/m.15899
MSTEELPPSKKSKKVEAKQKKREKEISSIWGNPAKTSKLDAQEEAEFDKLLEGENEKEKKKQKKKDGKTKLLLQQQQQKVDPRLKPCIIHCTVDASTTRNEVRGLFSSYNPTAIRISKAQKSTLREPVYYALVTVPNRAMALHAVLTFDNTDQEKTVGYRDTFHVVPHRSREENRKMRHAEIKTKRQRE